MTTHDALQQQRSGDLLSDILNPFIQQGAGAAGQAAAQQILQGPALQQITGTVIAGVLADTGFQKNVGAAAGTAAAKELTPYVIAATGAVVVAAGALVYMALRPRTPRDNPGRRPRERSR